MRLHTIQAIPYAKAIFDLALQNDTLVLWSNALQMLAKISSMSEGSKVLANPKIGASDKISLFAGVDEKLPEVMNLVRLLSDRKKLIILPNIYSEYQKLFFVYNKILEVKVVSASELTENQKNQILVAIKNRYSCEVLLQYCIDDKLIGGAVIYLPDRVIDSSIKGMLRRLKDNLLKSVHA